MKSISKKTLWVGGTCMALLLVGVPPMQVVANSTIEVVQQNKKITGIVVDQNGEPVIGANILQKGTANGVITDLDGRFAIDCPVGTSLTISFIGYLSQNVKAASDMRIILKEDSQTLEDVCVGGYGFVK